MKRQNTSSQKKIKHKIGGYDIYGNPKTVRNMQAELKAEVEAGKRGEEVTHDELKKLSEEWLTRKQQA